MSTNQVARGATSASTAIEKASGQGDSPSQEELRARAARARRELANTLDAIEYKMNVPRQLQASTSRITAMLRGLGRDNPLALVGVAAGAAVSAGASVGGVVWAIARMVQRRRSVKVVESR